MRKEYYKLLNNNQVLDILYTIDDMPYSKKYKILEAVLEKYSSEIVNSALINYRDNYMNKGKYNLNFLKNTLLYLCRKEKENEML